MGTMPPQTPHGSDSSAPLTKPVDWAIYMIGATLKVVANETLPLKYTSNDAGKLEILKTLNFYEAHDKYTWPDFSSLGYDFAQTMRLRRALIHDVYVALHMNGSLHVEAQPVMPESSEKGRKSGAQDGPMRSSKRRCQRNKVDEAADDTSSEASKIESLANNDFLAETMHELINRGNPNIIEYLKSEKDPSALADIVHDALVMAWDRPQAGYCNVPQDLAKKAVAWAAMTAAFDPMVANENLNSVVSITESYEKQLGRESSIELSELAHHQSAPAVV